MKASCYLNLCASVALKCISNLLTFEFMSDRFAWMSSFLRCKFFSTGGGGEIRACRASLNPVDNNLNAMFTGR